MDRTPDVEIVVALFRSPITELKLHLLPPAFAIASPSLELGEAMAKVGGSIPLVEPELSPIPSFFAGNAVAIAALFALGRRRPAKSIQPFSLKAALIHDWVFRDWNASWTNWPYSLIERIIG
jgi:hypothetical protein